MTDTAQEGMEPYRLEVARNLERISKYGCLDAEDKQMVEWATRRLQARQREEGDDWRYRTRRLLSDLLHDIHKHEGASIDDCPCSAVWSRQDEIAELLATPQREGEDD